MKKFITILVLGLLLASGMSSFATSLANEDMMLTKNVHVDVAQPVSIDEGAYISLEMNEATSNLRVTGMPQVPKNTVQVVIPFGSVVNGVSVEYGESSVMTLEKPIIPCQAPVIEDSDAVDEVAEFVINEQAYESSEAYPSEDFTYRTSVGLVGGTRSIIVSVECYPVRYTAVDSEIEVFSTVDVSVEYEEPVVETVFADAYDMLIIAPEEFTDELAPFVEHKNTVGVESYILTIEDIETEYTEGYDLEENMKLAIKDAIETNGITYVLLVGGLVGQELETWYVPVRYVSTTNEEAFLCDLYFSDIYMIEENETVYSSWDSNGNNIFGEWTTSVGHKDIIEGIPDVYIGRWAVQSAKEVTIMVEKTIAYEETPADDSWFKRLLVAGGDTYPDYQPPAYEAEIDLEVSIGIMDDFEPIRMFASTGALTGQSSFVKEFNNGAGFVHVAGHANPTTLVTHPPESEAKLEIMHMWRFSILDFAWKLLYSEDATIMEALDALFKPLNPQLKNGEKQPVLIVGGCHNSQFNVSFKNIGAYGLTHAYGYGIHGKNCWSWWVVVQKNDGAIASMGNTGYGMGLVGTSYPDGLDGWLLPRFFHNYKINGYENVGMAHSGAITDYINEFDINADDSDRQMVEQWVLLGDPSILPGGYE